ncbi:MAG: hypothetical protein KC486_32970 [Myxococcales bacterium]|nr:hypothetical protein [Myxococcales bacterium]
MSDDAPTSTWYLPGLIRGVALLGSAAAFLWLLQGPGEKAPLDAALLLLTSLGVAIVGARVLLVDGREPSGGAVFVLRTRMLNSFAEAVIAGMGGLILFFGLGLLVMVSEFRFMSFVFGLMNTGIGVAMTLWRPSFVLDVERRTLRRYPFGRALPLRVRELPYRVRITSDGYYSRAASAGGVRTGDVVRGVTRGGTFELEFVPGNDAAATDAAVRRWREIFGELGTDGSDAPSEARADPRASA